MELELELESELTLLAQATTLSVLASFLEVAQHIDDSSLSL